MIVEFEVTGAPVQLNLASYNDRGQHNSQATPLPWLIREDDPDAQHRGLAYQKPQMNTEVKFSINKDTLVNKSAIIDEGRFYAVPVKVFNQYNPDGNMVCEWVTNINPRNDSGTQNTATESEMIDLELYDSQNAWSFNVHQDITGTFGTIAPMLGNFGVINKYNYEINNTTGVDLKFLYKIKSTEGNILVKSENSERDEYKVKDIIEPSNRIKSESSQRNQQVMAEITLKPGVNKFSIETVLTVTGGGIGNSIHIECPQSLLN